jgi:acyl-CoA hydrolase
VGVKAWVENAMAGTRRHVSSAYLTFVAVDGNGRRLPVPRLIAENPDELRRYEDAGRRREQRDHERERKRHRHAAREAEAQAQAQAQALQANPV